MDVLSSNTPEAAPPVGAGPLVSVVVPFYNESGGIDRFYQDLSSALGRIEDVRFEVVCVDDGSSDDTLPILISLTERDSRFRLIELSRNFGKEAALSAGIDAATGDAVIPLDADLQDPPELISALIAHWRNGADVVLARRTDRSSDSFLKRTTAELFYRFHNKLSPIKIPDNVGDFRLMDRAVVDALKQLPERNRFMKGLFAWVGFKTVTVDYARSPRIAGTTKFSGWKLWNLALEGFTSFSTAPLKLWTYVGGFGALLSLIYATWIVLRTLFFGIDVPGYPSLLVAVLFVGSVQLVGIGVLGEYIGRIYLESKQRPLYIVRRRHGRGRLAAADKPGEPASGQPVTAQLEANRSSNPSVQALPLQAAAPAARAAANNAAATFAAIAVILATAFIYNGWLLDPRMFFYADAWDWLWRAEFFSWTSGIFTILPTAIYNDRPVGAALIKALYDAFGLNHWAFQFVWLSLHAINCVLLYTVAARYIGRGGALAAALLAAVWFSANNAVGYTAAIFDLLAATFCLATVLMRQRSRSSGDDLRYDLAGALCFLLAIRTKEFALGMVAVLFLMNLLVEKQSLRATIRQLWPYLVVFVVYASRYGQLLATTPRVAGDPYNLHLSLSGLMTSLAYYVTSLFYGESFVQTLVVAALLIALGVGLILTGEQSRKAALWGIAAFVILLGPVLLLPAHPDRLYLYAPHFFFAIAIGALIAKRTIPNVLAAVIAVGVLLPPMTVHKREHIVNFYKSKGETNQTLLKTAVKSLAPLSPGTAVFISGVELTFNPFWYGPGNSLKIAFKDPKLTVEVEKPEAVLIERFCGTAGARRFLRVDGKQATDVTSEVAGRCQ